MCIFIKKEKLNTQSNTHIEGVERDWDCTCCCLGKVVKSRADRKLMALFTSLSWSEGCGEWTWKTQGQMLKREEKRAAVGVQGPGKTAPPHRSCSLWALNPRTLEGLPPPHCRWML